MTFRVLDQGEWGRLLVDGIEPFATHGLPDPTHWILIAAIDDEGRIMGVSSLVEVVHNHWSLDSSVRKNPAVLMGLWEETNRVLHAAGVPSIHATVADSQPDVQALVERLGYLPAEGKLYILDLAQATVRMKES